MCSSRKDQTGNKRSPLFDGKVPAERYFKSRNCIIHSVKLANFPPKVIRSSAWLRRTNNTPHRTSVYLDENLHRGHDSPWTTWPCLNRLHSCYYVTRSSGINGNTSMETQHANAVLRQYTPRTYGNVPFLNDPAS